MSFATFALMKCTGTNAATETDCSRHPCFLSVDSTSTATTTYPVAVPTSGTNYSYETWIRLKCTSMGSSTYCQNFKFYGSAYAPRDNVAIYAGTQSSAATPTNNQSTIATVNQTTYYSLGTALAVGCFNGGVSKVQAVNDNTYYVILQLRVSAGAVKGDMGAMPFSFVYEEV